MFGLTPFNRNEVTKANRGDYVDIFNLMDDFFSDSFPTTRMLRNDTFKIDVRDEDNTYVVEAELPGFKKEEIHLDMNDDTLCISASKSEEKEDKQHKYIHRERKATSVKRSIYLKDINADEIKASFDDGLLTVTLPKFIEEKKGTIIDIE